SEPERGLARTRAQTVADAIPADRALALYGSAAGGSLARAVLGPKAAMAARAGADSGRSQEIFSESERLRERFGFSEVKEESAANARQNPRTIGLLLPLTGAYRAQGQRALRGAALAIDAFGG